MDKYIGTKLINAEPMTRASYNHLRNWKLPEDEDGSDDGYLVEYIDGGQSNHAMYKGYISWSPKAVFDKSYHKITALTFEQALSTLKLGMKVQRSGWNGKGMFLFLVPGSSFEVNRPPLLGIYPEGTKINYRPHIDMKTADGEIVPWIASQSDLLCEDWTIVQ